MPHGHLRLFLQLLLIATFVSVEAELFRLRRIITGTNNAPTSTSVDRFSPNCDFFVNLTDVNTRPIIQSPNYPRYYWPRLRCRWVITSQFGYRIQLVFDTFTLQPPYFQAGCRTDYLQLKDVTGTNRFCGTSPPSRGTYLSVGPKIELIFVSDGAWEYPGFSIRARLDKITCGGYAINPKPGLIQSPNYPKLYPMDSVCAWNIRVSTGSSIKLNCSKDFQLEYAQDCLSDFLLISSAGDDTMTSASRYCGKEGPGVVTSVGNKLNVIFRTDSWYNFGGFSCSYVVLDKNGKPTNPVTNNSTQTNNLQEKCNCGKDRRRNKRIVGGELVNKPSPWLVAITSNRGQLFCGGVLVAQEYVLTAGHCLNGLVAANISVAIQTYRPQWWAMNHLLPVEKIITHPRLKRFDFDAALLKIPTALPKDPQRICACLPPIDTALVGRRADVYGWGRNVNTRDDRLRKVTVPIHNDTVCKDVFSKFISITPRMMCAGEDGKDACEGDSGGPLLIEIDGRQTVVGVVSFGLGCGAPGYPGVYTKIPQVVDWIRENAGIKCR